MDKRDLVKTALDFMLAELNKLGVTGTNADTDKRTCWRTQRGEYLLEWGVVRRSKSHGMPYIRVLGKEFDHLEPLDDFAAIVFHTKNPGWQPLVDPEQDDMPKEFRDFWTFARQNRFGFKDNDKAAEMIRNLVESFNRLPE